MRYIKKPQTVEAIQVTGVSGEILGEIGQFMKSGMVIVNYEDEQNPAIILSIAENRRAYIGDFIVKRDGEFYPCKEKEFRRTHWEEEYYNSIRP